MNARAWFGLTIFLAACHGPAATSPFEPYLGTWALKVQQQNVMILVLTLDGDRVGGAVRHPEEMQVDGEGIFERIGGAAMTASVRNGVLGPEGLRLTTADDSEIVMKLVDASHAEVRYDPRDWTAPWKFERATGDLTLATELPKPRAATLEIAALQTQLRAMAEEDQAVRNEARPSERKILAVDAKHLPEILRIHAQHGWPRQSVVGREAANQFWLLVQHQKTDLQRRLLPEMERRVAEGEASRTDFAFLTDDVLQSQGKLQRFGTNASCKDGKAVLDPVEDPAGLAQRRRELHLEPVEENVRRGESWCQNFVRDVAKGQ